MTPRGCWTVGLASLLAGACGGSTNTIHAPCPSPIVCEKCPPSQKPADVANHKGPEPTLRLIVELEQGLNKPPCSANSKRALGAAPLTGATESPRVAASSSNGRDLSGSLVLQQDGKPGAVPDDATRKTLESSLRVHMGPDLRELRRIGRTPYYLAIIKPDSLAKLQCAPTVKKADRERVDRIALDHSVPTIGADQLAGVVTGGGTGKGVTVALLDTGIVANHPFLEGRIVKELCFAQDCPGGPSSAPAKTFHGTAMAGIIAGVATQVAQPTGPSRKLRGVAPDVGIVAIQVFDLVADPVNCPDSEKCLLTYEASQIAALEYLVNDPDHLKNLGVVNLSFGNSEHFNVSCSGDDRRAPYIDALAKKGIAVVASAGNSYEDGLGIGRPACIDSVTAVAATGIVGGTEQVPTRLQNGVLTDLLAPGVAVTTSQSVDATHTGTYAAVTGTSVAAAHVSGAIAALRSLSCAPSTEDVLKALERSGVAIYDDRDGTNLQKPRINVLEALKFLPKNCSRQTQKAGN